MCGIAGIYKNDSHRSILREQIEQMLSVTRHRGPDDQGVYINDYCSLGMNRLSIIDLKTGSQPIGSPDGRYQLVCNGEIYNFPQLRDKMQREGYVFKTKTDVEVILPLFIYYGVEGFQQLDGMFAFAIIDTQTQTLYLCRDRYGIKPLYYLKDDSGDLFFASEIKSIHKVVDDRELDLPVFMDFIITGYSETGRSVWKNIMTLKPGNCYIKNKEQHESLKCIFDEPAEDYSDREKAKKDLREAVIHDIEAQLISDVPLGVFLSGGVDSSIILGVANKILEKKYPAFSIDFSDSTYSESDKFRNIAKKFHAEHYIYKVNEDLLDYVDEVLTACDEPFGDMAALPTYLLSRHTAEKVKVALSGDGSDEYMFGYVHNSYQNSKRDVFESKHLHKLSKLLPVIHPKQYSLISRTKNRGAGKPQNLYRMLSNKLFKQYMENCPDESHGSSTEHDRHAYLPNDILYKTDRMSMFCSLETRVPFLGNKTVSVAKRIPKEFQVNRTRQKTLLTEAFSDILPEDIRDQKKHGFTVPAGEWFKSRYTARSFVKTINESSFATLYNARMLEKIIKEHFYNRFNHGRFLYRIYIASNWAEKYNPVIKV
ncbi:MAG: asparagine synthase (glutamine-hydrolyzing) [Bacteroidetes bacterium]|nr:asparagine synthase (glutamine-hydrolyzing) [Bacteroidota bacterium]